jgi:hypothetical protein
MLAVEQRIGLRLSAARDYGHHGGMTATSHRAVVRNAGDDLVTVWAGLPDAIGREAG